MGNIRPLVSVGGVGIPEPSTYTSNTATFVDSARNVRGVVIGAVIREDVSKIELSWRYLTTEQWMNILNLFSGRNGGRFYNNVTFYDQNSGNWITKRMYVSDRNAQLWWRDEITGRVKGWIECKLSLVEV